MHIKNAYQTTTLLVNAYQKFISNYYLSCKCQSTMNLTCNHQYCQPFSTCFPPAIFTQPDTTVGIPVGFCLGLRSSSVCVFCVAFIHVVKTKWGCNFWYKQWRDWLFVKKMRTGKNTSVPFHNYHAESRLGFLPLPAMKLARRKITSLWTFDISADLQRARELRLKLPGRYPNSTTTRLASTRAISWAPGIR